jgi:hypothetical protein
MPGWIIQGVRGEGKSLAAVAKIREYMLRGRPVATNLNLYLEQFLPADNAARAYRLPDHPRLVDFQMLSPAYDPKYKGEDMNGLLVLDELGTWMNSRNWNDKSRLELLNWLFLSRKDHWDIILLAQDYEMIDNQVRTTLCDYLVQASRLDRQKVPYLAGLLNFLGLNSKLPRIHRYHVYYGMSLQSDPVETWSFTGKEFYSGYDTNQKFLNGMEPLGGTLVDMRASYSYIPACYLTRHIFKERLQKQIAALDALPAITTGQEVHAVAQKKGVGGKEQNYLKIGLLSAGLVGFLVYRGLSGGFSLPASASASLPAPSAAPVAAPAVTSSGGSGVSSSASAVPASSGVAVPASGAVEVQSFIDYLISHFRPRLSVSAFSPDFGFFGNVDFYDNGVLVERYPISSLHALGVALVHREYGADLIYKGKAYIVTAWKLPPVSDVVAVADSDKKS